MWDLRPTTQLFYIISTFSSDPGIQVDYRAFRLREKHLAENYRLAAQPDLRTSVFDDADVATLSPERYRQQVSYCAQTPALFGDSVYDNLIFPWQIRNKQPDPQALVADLQRFGLGENMLEKSINELSGGEKQRVSLIRNLQFLPRVLLLDEITSALDDSNKQNVIDIIHGYATEKQVAVLWVTHDRNEISHADEVITLQPAGGNMQEAQHERA